MLKKIGTMLLLCVMILNLLVACNGNGEPPVNTDAGTTEGEVTTEGLPLPEPEPEDPNKRSLKIMSFNVHNNLPVENGALTEAAQNRFNAVKAEIETYKPDLLGIQEDVTTWTSNLALDGYTTIYDPEVSGSYEHCAIYFKSDLTCMEYGWQWLTSDGTNGTVALTVADILAGGDYAMTDAELQRLDITESTRNSFLRDGIRYYFDDEGNKKFVDSYNYLTARRMTYVVLDVNGQKVIYVNTHLQHRSQDAVYISDALLKLRNNERLAQFAMVQEKIEALKTVYTDAVVVITGDFNDLPDTDIYKAAAALYNDSAKVAESVVGMKGTWNAYYSASLHGDNYPNQSATINTDTLDYCFVSSNASVDSYRSGLGYASITVGEGANATTKTLYTSDHRPIIADISFITPGTPDAPDTPIVYPDYSGVGGDNGGGEEGGETVTPDPTPTVTLQNPANAANTVSTYTGTPNTAWFTGESAEYTLTTADQLMGLAQLTATNDFNAITVKLGANMVINSGDIETVKANASAYKWSAKEFKGTLDGQGHYISGLYIDGKGLFDSACGTLQNFSLVNTYVNGENKTGVGALVGTRSAGTLTIFNVYVEAEVVSGGNSVGGVLGSTVYDGETSNTSVTYVTFQGKVSGAEGTGGLIGYVHGTAVTKIKNCAIDATVVGSGKYSGGLVGYMLGSNAGSEVVEIASCIVNGTVTGANNGVGGLSGFAYQYTNSVKVDSCAINVTIDGAGKHMGGLFGRVGNCSDVKISNCSYEGKISDTSGSNGSGAIIGWVNWGTVSVQNMIVALASDSTVSSVLGHFNNGGNTKGYYSNVYYDSALAPTGATAFTSANMVAEDSAYEGKATADLQAITETLGDAWTAVTGDYPVPTILANGTGALVEA